MGWFDWLWRDSDPLTLAPDSIWLSKQAKLLAIASRIAALLADAEGPDVLFVVAHFPDCLADLQAVVAEAAPDDRRVIVTTVAALDRLSRPTLAPERSVVLLVGQRHLLAKHDAQVVEYARRLGCRCRVEFHLSMDDALMRVYNSEWMADVLQKLGMKEDEAIQSRMVSRRIREAQEKLERVVPTDLPAQSDLDWVELNGKPQ